MLVCERPFRIRETIAARYPTLRREIPMSPAAFGSGEETWNG